MSGIILLVPTQSPLPPPSQAPTKVTCAEMYVLPAVRSRHYAAMALTLSDMRAIAEEMKGGGMSIWGGGGVTVSVKK